MKFNLETVCTPIAATNINNLLSEYRFTNGRSFPISYKEFIKQYGYGRSCGEFLVFTSGEHSDNIRDRSGSIQNTYADVLGSLEYVWFDLEPDVNFEMLKRLYPFSISENGYYLFWDIESGKDEIDIYMTDFRGIGFIKVADSLYTFFEKVSNEHEYKKVFPLFHESPLPNIFPRNNRKAKNDISLKYATSNLSESILCIFIFTLRFHTACSIRRTDEDYLYFVIGGEEDDNRILLHKYFF